MCIRDSPYGEYTKEEAANTGRPCFFWDVDTMDWDSQDANAIANEVMLSLIHI